MEPSNNPRATPSLRTATFPFSCISIDGPRRFFLQIIVNILRTVVVARPPLCRRETQPENWEAESDRWRFLMVEFLVIFNSARIFFSFFFLILQYHQRLVSYLWFFLFYSSYLTSLSWITVSRCYRRNNFAFFRWFWFPARLSEGKWKEWSRCWFRWFPLVIAVSWLLREFGNRGY